MMQKTPISLLLVQGKLLALCSEWEQKRNTSSEREIISKSDLGAITFNSDHGTKLQHIMLKRDGANSSREGQLG